MLSATLSANALLQAAHVDLLLPRLAQADWLVAHFELPDEILRHAFALARANGVATYLNPSPWRTIDPDLQSMTDALVVNATEAASLFAPAAIPSWQRSDWLAHLPTLASGIGWQGRLLVVTLAEQGCVAIDGAGRVSEVAAFPVEQVDATVPATLLVVDCCRRWPVVRTCQGLYAFANACGAHVASRAGVFAHLPHPADVAAVLASASPGRV
jgi:ribokinase